MPEPKKPAPLFSEAARRARLAARAAYNRAQADHFGEPELFIARAGTTAFTWELRRFGGLVLQRGEKPFPSRSEAQAAGAEALAAMVQQPDRPRFKRQHNPYG